MYHHFQGTLAVKKAGTAVVDVQGVGYLLNISESSFRELPPQGQSVFLYAWQAVRENEISLYGFAMEEERALFLNLIKVSNVGPTLAMQILGQAPLQRLVQAIITGDTLFLKTLKGLGKKTAERLVVELRDSLKGVDALPKSSSSESLYPEDAYLALLTLGLSSEMAAERLEKVAGSGERPGDTQEWIRLALSHG